MVMLGVVSSAKWDLLALHIALQVKRINLTLITSWSPLSGSLFYLEDVHSSSQTGGDLLHTLTCKHLVDSFLEAELRFVLLHIPSYI